MKKILLIIGLSTLLFSAETKDFQFLADNNAKIKKINFNDNFKTLIVYVNDDGTKKDGFAESIALELFNKGFRNKDVSFVLVKDEKIIAEQEKGGYISVLGRAQMVVE